MRPGQAIVNESRKLLKDWHGDGIIARVENRPVAEAIRRLGVIFKKGPD